MSAVTPFIPVQPKWECLRCKQDEIREDDMDIHTVFAGSQEEPPEYENQCPHCGSTNVKEMSIFWCRTCEDVVVSDDGEQCSECQTCEAEERAEL